MFEYVLEGRIWQDENNKISLKLPYKLDIKGTKGTKIILDLSIKDSKIIAKVVSKTKVDDLDRMKNLVGNTISTILDSYGYIHGIAIDFEISHVNFNGERKPFNIGITKLKQDVKNRPIQNFNEILQLLYQPKYRQLGIALADLRRSIKYPLDSEFHCYRAIESLMQFFKEKPNEKPKVTWKKFRSELNISEDYVKFRKVVADKLRHGEQISTDIDDSLELKMRAWKVMDRFIIYAMNNCSTLDRKRYPELI